MSNKVTDRLLTRTSHMLGGTDVSDICKPKARIVGHTPINKALCRVAVELDSQDPLSADDCAMLVMSSLGEGASVVRDSFQPQEQGSAIFVGLVRKSPIQRSMAKSSLKEMEKKGHMVRSGKNVMMDSTDNTLWEMREDETGRAVLSRTSAEDLGSLVSLAHVRQPDCRSNLGTTLVTASLGDYVSFFNPRTGGVDFGYYVAERQGRAVVISRALVEQISIDPLMVLASANIGLDSTEQRIHYKLSQSGYGVPPVIQSVVNRNIRASQDAVALAGRPFAVAALAPNSETPLDPESIPYNDVHGYYAQVYSYAPEYYEQFDKMFKEMGF